MTDIIQHVHRCASAPGVARAVAGLALAVFVCPCAADEDEYVKVRIEGTAPGAGVGARQAAVAVAERAAVRQLAEAAVGLRRLSLLNPIVDNAPRYIRSTQLIRYDATSDGVEVEVETFVKRKALLREAARLILPHLPRPPTVLVLIAERIGSDAPLRVDEPGVAETAMVKALRAARLTVTGSDVARACYPAPQLLEMVQGGVELAQHLARHCFAEVAVVGVATSTEGPEPAGGNVFANEASIDVHVLRAADGKLIEALSQEAVVHSVDPLEGGRLAIEDACAKLAADLKLYATLAALGGGDPGGVLLTVETPGGRERFDLLLAALGEASGGGEVEVLFYTDSLARVRVHYEGLMGPFMDQITTRQYAGRALEIQRAVERDVVVRFVSPE